MVLISDYNVIRDVVLEMRGGCVSLLSCSASPLRFSHIVMSSDSGPDEDIGVTHHQPVC
jgi:hypothetical protein